MADLKISEFTVATDVIATDLIPVIRGGGQSFVNNILSVNTLCSNLPLIGNTGITKNIVTVVAAGAIPTNKTLYKLTGGNYTLGAGQPGQMITLIYTGVSHIFLTGNNYVEITGMVSGSTTLLFDGGMWYAITATLSNFA